MSARELHSILVPVDFSPGSESALERAVELGQEFAADVHVLHVVRLPPWVGSELVLVEPEDRARTLDTWVRENVGAQLEALGADAPGVQRHIIIGNPAETICNFAREHGCDLIVMATRGGRRLGHALLGTVVHRVLHHAPCPVMTIHAKDAAA